MKREVTVLLNVVLALALVGVLMVYSAGTVRMYGGDAMEQDEPFRYLWSRVAHTGIGLVLMVLASRFDYHNFKRRGILWGLAGMTLVLLGAVLLVGALRLGATRWFSILGFSFQPSELAKAAVVVLLAVKLSENQANMKDLMRGFLPPMLWLSLFTVLILAENDLSTTLVIGAVAMLMILMAGARWQHLLLSAVPVVPAVGALCILWPHRLQRLIAFVNPWEHRDDGGYQVIQALSAFARGSVMGLGPGGSQQKLSYLPEFDSDFMFAIWAEEMGLVGSVALVVLFAAFLVVGMRLALCAPDLLGGLLAGGIVALITVQALFHMGVNTGLMPTTGLTLPFISAGGSSLIVYLALVGVLLNVGSQAGEPEDTSQFLWARQP
jgi:cell division protein FtsW